MNYDNRQQAYGQQFGFDHYDLPPGRKSILEKIFGETFARKASSPVVATAALLVCGAAFAGIIIAAYPDGQNADEQVPIVKADTLAYKETPAEPGGMEIPNRGTTIFQTMAESGAQEPAPIENLLSEEKPVDKLAAFQRQVEEISAEESAKTAPDAKPADAAEATMNIANAGSVTSPEADDVPAAETAPIELKKIASAPEPEAGVSPPAQTDLASAAIDIPDPVAPAGVADPKPAEVQDTTVKPEIHKAGENPETLAYVRSVLDRKDGVAPAAAEEASKVEPAAGAAGAAKAITPGNYYIQLGSVTSESGAASEWGKLQKSFASELSTLSYRVQAANLGERGTFYRIQAGPISKESAKALCESIAAKKPGGCLVTQ